MKKDMTLSANKSTMWSIQGAITSMKAAFFKPINALEGYYSSVLGKTINTRQTLLLLNAQVAFVAATFPIDFSLILRVVFAGWFLSALLKCKTSGV